MTTKGLTLPNSSRSLVGVRVVKKVLGFIYAKYARAVETILVKQCSIMYKTLTYYYFEAFDFNFDMGLYYTYF